MTEEKAQDTLKVGIEELLEKEGGERATGISLIQAVIDECKKFGKDGIGMIIKSLQAELDKYEQDSKTPFEDA